MVNHNFCDTSKTCLRETRDQASGVSGQRSLLASCLPTGASPCEAKRQSRRPRRGNEGNLLRRRQRLFGLARSVKQRPVQVVPSTVRLNSWSGTTAIKSYTTDRAIREMMCRAAHHDWVAGPSNVTSATALANRMQHRCRTNPQTG